MARWRFRLVLVAMALTLAWVASHAGGVVIVSSPGGDGYRVAKNGFLQAAYGSQLPGLEPKAVELAGTEADAASLQALKEKAPDLVFAVGSQAVKETRKALPNAFIVYAMVYFPETEGFTQDSKMIGISSMGSAKEMGIILKGIMGKNKSLVILHDASVAPSIRDLAASLKAEAGLDARGVPVEGGAALKAAVEGLKGQTEAILFVPDPASMDPDGFKAAIGQCLATGIAPFAFSDALVAAGALCGSYYAPEEIGAQGAALARKILDGKVPSEKIIAPAKSASSCNKATAAGLKVKFPREFHPETTYE
jgi:ABC-type uncharacterized transport system substrate-binding protein